MIRAPAHQAPGARRSGQTSLAGVLVGALLGGAAGFAAGLLAAPYLHLQSVADALGSDRDADSEAPPIAGPPRATGELHPPDPADRHRYGSGAVSVYDGLVRLGADFQAAPGPKYHLYLVPRTDLDRDTLVEDSLFVDLGPLRAFVGAQDYPIPAGADPADFGSLAVWSEQLNVPIAVAALRPAP